MKWPIVSQCVRFVEACIRRPGSLGLLQADRSGLVLLEIEKVHMSRLDSLHALLGLLMSGGSCDDATLSARLGLVSHPACPRSGTTPSH